MGRIRDPAQVLSIQKRKKEVEEAGKVFFATRKREIENYLCPDLIEEITGVAVTFTDTCDAKKIIGRAVGMKPDNVLDKCKRAARTVLTGMCYSVGSATRQGSSSLTRFIGQSAITSSTWRR